VEVKNRRREEKRETIKAVWRALAEPFGAAMRKRNRAHRHAEEKFTPLFAESASRNNQHERAGILAGPVGRTRIRLGTRNRSNGRLL